MSRIGIDGIGTDTLEGARAAGIDTPLQVSCKHCRKKFYVEMPSTFTGLMKMELAGFICSKCDLIEHK